MTLAYHDVCIKLGVGTGGAGSRVMILKLPVAEVKMSTSPTHSSRVTTWKPSMHACSAQMGSISVISTRAPAPRMAKAQPLPTSP